MELLNLSYLLVLFLEYSHQRIIEEFFLLSFLVGDSLVSSLETEEVFFEELRLVDRCLLLFFLLTEFE